MPFRGVWSVTSTRAGTAILLLVALTGIGVTTSGATSLHSSRTSEVLGTRSSDSIHASGEAFATALLQGVPIPRGAVRSSQLAKPLNDPNSGILLGNLVDVHREYRLTSALDVGSFVRSHVLSGAVVSGPNSASGSNINPVTVYSETIPITDRHISFEEIDFTVGSAPYDSLELRIDALGEWEPVRTVLMPTSGGASLTVYRKLSLSESSSDPISIELSRPDVLKFRKVISDLSNTSNSMCAEDSTLFKITIVKKSGAPITWSATADECPGILTVLSGSSTTLLYDRSCPLETLVASMLPKGKADAVRKQLGSCWLKP